MKCIYASIVSPNGKSRLHPCSQKVGTSWTECWSRTVQGHTASYRESGMGRSIPDVTLLMLWVSSMNSHHWDHVAPTSVGIAPRRRQNEMSSMSSLDSQGMLFHNQLHMGHPSCADSFRLWNLRASSFGPHRASCVSTAVQSWQKLLVGARSVMVAIVILSY